VFVAQRKDVVFEKPMKVDMSAAKPRPALLAKKLSVGLGSVFVSMEKEKEDGSLLAKKSNGGLNMVFKFRGVRMEEVESNNSIDTAVTASDEKSVEEEHKPRTLADIIPPISNMTSPTPLMFPMVKDDSFVLQSLASVGRNDRN
jgi:hypothetical protein